MAGLGEIQQSTVVMNVLGNIFPVKRHESHNHSGFKEGTMNAFVCSVALINQLIPFPCALSPSPCEKAGAGSMAAQRLASASSCAGWQRCSVTDDGTGSFIDKLPCAVCISEYEKMMVVL